MTDDRWQNQWHDSFSSTFYSFSRKFKLNFKVSALKALKWAVIRRSQLAAIGSTFSPGDGRDIYGCVCRFKLTKFSWITGRREVGCLWLAAAKILRSHRRREIFRYYRVSQKNVLLKFWGLWWEAGILGHFGPSKFSLRVWVTLGHFGPIFLYYIKTLPQIRLISHN